MPSLRIHQKHPHVELSKSLFCLSRYGEELTIHATRDELALSTTNTSHSAFCRFKYRRQFFSRYSLAQPAELAEFFDEDEGPSVSGQLQTKVAFAPLPVDGTRC